ncbi:TlpA family protein disulfide reductase [Maribacter luteus]|uniref:Redoxin domain-containing protein n=1 Tax=Maribacter luteus TaxID=2594478 RepID=A0A6I2MFZ9_9FLAO|nr:TlpA disulfide reductase family protein [Maribacter luteus]MRX62801.1 redoxin domain-containing protein [Maribacter luteus]
MKKKKPDLSTIIFAIVIILMIVPQTRMPIQEGLSKIRMVLFSPSKMDEEEQIQLEPFTYRLSHLDGSAANVEIGNGNVTFLSYWATWCPPCRAELPSIQELYNDYGDKMDFVLITHEDPEVIQTFLDKKQYNLPVVLPQMETPASLFERTIPTNYIIDKKGKVVIKEQGATDWYSDKVRKTLDVLVEE